MNHVYLSPHFPPNYYLFCAHLRRLGVNVLAIADEPYESLSPRSERRSPSTIAWTICTAMISWCAPAAILRTATAS